MNTTDLTVAQEIGLAENNREGRDVQAAELEARALAEVKGQIVLAHKFPRSPEMAITRINKELDRFAFADKAFYSFPRGGTKVEGPSVYLARAFARYWGNVKSGYKIIADSATDRTVEGFAWDMETNFQSTKQAEFKKLQQRKDKQTGETKWVTPDERDLRELTNKHAAICERNALLDIFPSDYVAAFIATAKKNVRDNISKEDITQRRAMALKSFDELGIKQHHLEEYIGYKIESWTVDTIVDLIGIHNSLKNGQMKREEIIPSMKKGDDKGDDSVTSNQGVKDKLKNKTEEAK